MRQNHPNDIEKIVNCYRNRSDDIRYSRKVGLTEIEKNDFNLNISRYVNTAKPEPVVDLEETNLKLKALEQAFLTAKEKHNKQLKELGLPPI
ncbi:N-6 DNA methylase [Bathymodiolus japonicus methanotrophic gill symbiont]|uniref:N-6 DNA methylase n=1 Tax=Bathymodiolus japonicus methanotrophic gill symbiont TaxID=113269 RepID=UPI001E293804|nr:N-6 DNA methylase [Bathymodiolus japonicus methanotrophic gill symbiont]